MKACDGVSAVGLTAFSSAGREQSRQEYSSH